MVVELIGSFVDNSKQAAPGTIYRLVMERQGVLMSALTQDRRARAEARRRHNWALGEVGGRADAASPNPMNGSSNPAMGCIETRLLEKPDKFDGQDSLNWKYIAKTYIRASLPNIRVFLVKSAETSGDMRNVVLNPIECLSTGQNASDWWRRGPEHGMIFGNDPGVVWWTTSLLQLGT